MAMTLVSTVTVGAGGASQIVWTGIPQNGKDLMILFSLRNDTADFVGDIYPQPNSDTTWSNYADRMLYGTGSVAASMQVTLPYAFINGSTSTSNTFGNGQIYLTNYTSAASKSMFIDSITENNATSTRQAIQAVRYSPTTAITSFRISGGGNFVQHSTASLYIIS